MIKLLLPAAKSFQSCLTLCYPIDSSPPGSANPWDSPGKNTEVDWISFSNAWKWKVKVKSLSCVQLLATPQTAAHQPPLYMGFSRQEYWSGVPLPSLSHTWVDLNFLISQKKRWFMSIPFSVEVNTRSLKSLQDPWKSFIIVFATCSIVLPSWDQNHSPECWFHSN